MSYHNMQLSYSQFRLGTDQHKSSHLRLQVLVGGGGAEDILHHLDTEATRLRGPWTEDVTCLTSRETARASRHHRDGL